MTKTGAMVLLIAFTRSYLSAWMASANALKS